MNKTLYVILISLILLGCGEKGSISGGPEDTTPLKIIEFYPFYNSTQVDRDAVIQIIFNKNVNSRTVSDALNLYPHFEHELTVYQNMIIITPDSLLNDSTVYKYSLGNSLKDDRNNYLDDVFECYFSTGSSIEATAVKYPIEKNFVEPLVIEFSINDTLFTHKYLTDDPSCEVMYPGARIDSITISGYQDLNRNHKGDPKELVREYTTYNIKTTELRFLVFPDKIINRCYFKDSLHIAAEIANNQLFTDSTEFNIINNTGDITPYEHFTIDDKNILIGRSSSFDTVSYYLDITNLENDYEAEPVRIGIAYDIKGLECTPSFGDGEPISMSENYIQLKFNTFVVDPALAEYIKITSLAGDVVSFSLETDDHLTYTIILPDNIKKLAKYRLIVQPGFKNISGHEMLTPLDLIFFLLE